MGELLPCPFCNCDRAYQRGFLRFECPECGAQGPAKGTKAEAITAWNTRPRTEGRGEGEPVAWRSRPNGYHPSWMYSADKRRVEDWTNGGYVVEPLYASPIREPEISRGAVIEIIDRACLHFDDPGPQRFGSPQAADAILNLAPVGGRGDVLLAELFALVRGECPRLLNEDSGGDGSLSLRIEDHLAALPPPLQEQEEGSSQSQPVLSPKSDTADLVAALNECFATIRMWSGSKFLSGEKMAANQQADAKSHLYGDLCHLGNVVWWVRDELESRAADGASSRYTGQLRDEQNPSLNEESQTNGS